MTLLQEYGSLDDPSAHGRGIKSFTWIAVLVVVFKTCGMVLVLLMDLFGIFWPLLVFDIINQAIFLLPYLVIG